MCYAVLDGPSSQLLPLMAPIAYVTLLSRSGEIPDAINGDNHRNPGFRAVTLSKVMDGLMGMPKRKLQQSAYRMS